MTPLRAVLAGAAAGAIGTAMMDSVWYGRYRRGGGELGPIAWDLSEGLESWDDAPAPAQVGKRVLEGFLQRPLKSEHARLINNLVHWGYGIAWGALFGVVAGSTRMPRVAYGVPFGLGVWASAYVTLPAAGIYKPMREYDATTLWKDATAHVAFGLGTATAFALAAGRGRARGG